MPGRPDDNGRAAVSFDRAPTRLSDRDPQFRIHRGPVSWPAIEYGRAFKSNWVVGDLMSSSLQNKAVERQIDNLPPDTMSATKKRVWRN